MKQERIYATKTWLIQNIQKTLPLFIREFVGIYNVVTNLMRATNYIGYFVYFVALGFWVIG